MKKIYLLLLIFILGMSIDHLHAQTFTVGCPSSNTVLSCNNSPITMTANSGVTPYSYTWTIPGSTINGVYANVTIPGTWTVTGQNLTTSVTTQQTFAIAQSLQSPTIVVTPTIDNITCASGPVCFTVTSNLSPNVTTNWFIVQSTSTVYVGVPQGTINIFCAGQPGVYWAESVNNLTGCKSTKSVQVTASIGVPAFVVTSPTNFTIGCSTTSITSMQVTNVITSPVANAPCQYTFVPPATTGTPTTFTINPNLNGITVPGTWVAYVKDLTNNCISSQSISIIQNTITPPVYHIKPLSLLDCKNTSMVMTGISSNTNTTITWTVPPTNTVNPTNTVQVTIDSSVPSSSNVITSIGNYSLGVIDNSNLCRSTFTIQVIQDIRKPIFTTSALSNSVITCYNSSVTIVPVMSASLSVALVPTFTWFAPPSGPGVPGASFQTTVAGTHTALAMSSVNGCTSLATHIVGIDIVAPTASNSTYNAPCPFTGTITLLPTLGSNSIGITYSWTPPSGATTSGLTGAFLTTNMIGNYTCVVTNSINGCSNTVTISVDCVSGLQNLNSNATSISVYPNPSSGIVNIESTILTVDLNITIFDIHGKLLMKKPLSEIKNELHLNLPKGCYFYRINIGNELVKRDKLIIE